MKKSNIKKTVTIRENTHQLLKVLAAETGRKIHGDLADDLLMLGIEEYRRAAKKILPSV
ncbi:MAG: hypothetical protein IJU70_12035 [Lentisphaeria bacterium]|nr:hypothetical protein [Lentisphaeria bacterium]